MTEPRTEAGKRMLNIPAIRNSYSTAAWVEEIRGVEAEATAAAEQRLRERIEALRAENPTLDGRLYNAGVNAVLGLLDAATEPSSARDEP